MATDLDLSLTDQKIEELAQVIALKHMATIAIKYLGLSYEEVEDFRTIKQNDSKGFNRDILVIWRNRNAGINQVQVRHVCHEVLYLFIKRTHSLN